MPLLSAPVPGFPSSAGFVYSGERFNKYFCDFSEKYHFRDMYTGGFTPFVRPKNNGPTGAAMFISTGICRPRKPVYDILYHLVKNKDYFVLTTNVDHCFQKAGFDKHRLFYTQGDYGLFQCSVPCHQSTYDNASVIRQMIEAQGIASAHMEYQLCPKERRPKMTVPSALIPIVQNAAPMSMNLRADMTFVQDKGWHEASNRYADFYPPPQKASYFVFGVRRGTNTPGIIKYPFWQMTFANKNAVYICISLKDALCPKKKLTGSLSVSMKILAPYCKSCALDHSRNKNRARKIHCRLCYLIILQKTDPCQHHTVGIPNLQEHLPHFVLSYIQQLDRLGFIIINVAVNIKHTYFFMAVISFPSSLS